MASFNRYQLMLTMLPLKIGKQHFFAKEARTTTLSRIATSNQSLIHIT